MKRPRFFKRRELWMPTWPLVMTTLLVTMSVIVLTGRNLHSFLAVTRGADEPDLLVVEGWMPDYNLPKVIEEYRRGPYVRVGATGIALDQGSYLQEYENYGQVTAAALKKMGLKDSDLIVGGTTDTRRHRTYTAAKSLKRAVDESGIPVDSLVVLSQAAHARRTWVIFRKVFGEGAQVGIVALPDENYDNDRWWGSSAGIKTVGMELIAFVYESLLDSGRTGGD